MNLHPRLHLKVDARGRLTEAGEAMEEMHVVLEADTEEQIEAARVQASHSASHSA